MFEALVLVSFQNEDIASLNYKSKCFFTTKVADTEWPTKFLISFDCNEEESVFTHNAIETLRFSSLNERNVTLIPI